MTWNLFARRGSRKAGATVADLEGTRRSDPLAGQGEATQDEVAHAAQAVFAATAQIGLALRESQDQVAGLGALIEHLNNTIAAVRAAPRAQPDPIAPDSNPFHGILEQLETEVFKGVQLLQFYDRMVQHLGHLQNYLISVGDRLSNLPEAGTEDWHALYQRLRARLLTDEQRGLLDLFLSQEPSIRASAQIKRRDVTEPGGAEFF